MEELRRTCRTLQKCQELKPEDLKGKYRKAHEKAISECREAVRRCVMDTVPWGLMIHESCAESAGIWLREFRQRQTYKDRTEALEVMILSGDCDGIMAYLRWLRDELSELARMGGVIKPGGEKLLE